MAEEQGAGDRRVFPRLLWPTALAALVGLVAVAFLLAACSWHRAAQARPVSLAVEVLKRGEIPNLRGGVRAVAMGREGKSIVIADLDQLAILDTDSLATTKVLQVKSKDDHDLSCYWDVEGFAALPDQRSVLVLDRCIVLETGQTKRSLEVKAAISKGQPFPTPLDVSSDGRRALVWVHSFHSEEFAALGLFDLDSGKLIRVSHVGGHIVGARFLSDQRIVVLERNGRLAIESLDGRVLRVLSPGAGGAEDGLIGGRILVAGGARHVLCSSWVNGRFLLVAHDLEENKIAFQDDCDGGIATTADGHYVLYQQSRASKKMCGCGQHPLREREMVLRVRELPSGKLRGEAILHEHYGLLLAAPQSGVLYGVSLNDAINKLSVNLGILENSSL